MKCPHCDNSDTKVIDSREVEEGRAIRRRRECEKCTERFSTREKIELLNLIVSKRAGEKEEYNKDKITNSLSIATNKRLKESELEDLIAGVEAQIFARGKNKIETREIGNIILERLKKLDEVAYLRYASVFKSFGSGNRFTKELNKF